MYRILSMTPPAAVDGHVDLNYENRTGWAEDLGATVLGILVGDEHCGPFVALSYVAPREDQMPLSFAHAHASDNWRISVRGTTNMGHDAYAQGQWRFHDGGVPYASDNFAWGPDGGYGIIVFADRRGFAIEPVKAEIAAKVAPQQEMTAKLLGIDMQSPCPGAPAIATTMGLTERAHLNGGFESASSWDEIAPGVRMSVGVAGERDAGPVLVFLDCAAGAEAVGTRTLGSETLIAPVAGSVVAGRRNAHARRRATRRGRRRTARSRGRRRRRAARCRLCRPARACAALSTPERSAAHSRHRSPKYCRSC